MPSCEKYFYVKDMFFFLVFLGGRGWGLIRIHLYVKVTTTKDTLFFFFFFIRASNFGAEPERSYLFCSMS